MRFLEIRQELKWQHVCGDGPISCAACIAFSVLNAIETGQTMEEMESHVRKLWEIGMREKVR